eukprot:5852369-Lingulodinium_polyedra.AAC.1
MFGGPTEKYTCISGTLDDLNELHGTYCDRSHAHEASIGLDAAGQHLTRRLQTYPSGLNHALAERFVRSFDRVRSAGSGPGGGARNPVASTR